MSKVLLYDIETTPNLGYIWGKYQQDVIAYKEQWHLLCFAWKWLDEEEVHIEALPDYPIYRTDPDNDIMLTQRLWELFDEADVVIAHNGDSFDQKKSQARMLAHGMSPPTPYKQIDTKKVAKRYFNFNSNKLDDLGDILQLGHKAQTGGFSLWLGCMNNDPEAWQTMKDYNVQDVVLLEKIYLAMRPWIINHPASDIDRPEACPKCGDGPMQSRGWHVTKVTKRKRFVCMNCGGWSLGRESHKLGVQFTN